MTPKDPRDIEKGCPRAQYVAKLRRLGEAIEKEAASTVQVAGERLRIPASAECMIEHERQGTRQEREFRLISNEE